MCRRALRLYPTKQKAIIIIPILEEHKKENNFGYLIRVIKNIANYDYHVSNAIKNNNNK
jgi:hypothetical protein